MKKQLLICLFMFFIFESCKRSSSESSQNNEVTGTLNAKDGTITPFVATGSQARFSRMMTNGFDHISISGSARQGVIGINLTNINSSGTYSISAVSGVTGEKSISGSFSVGSFWSNAFEYFSANSHLTVTVDEITANYIKGSFEMTCEITTGGIVQVTNGSFKGKF